GGVTQEINRAIRGETLYRLILDGLDRTFRVDVITGASAGGLNGALLGMAMAHGASLDTLRRLWLDRGDFSELLWPALARDPPSLLKGDESFLPALVSALRDIQGQGPPTDRAEVPVDLTVTTTLVNGEPVVFEDDFGTVLTEVEHRGELRFVRSPE